MGMHVTDKELQKHIKSIGYKGCKNCKHQIAPLRMCRWAEQGGDGRIHWICPMWDKAESEDEEGEQPKIIKCPNCGNVQFADKEWCPDCGAKMVEPQESGD